MLNAGSVQAKIRAELEQRAAEQAAIEEKIASNKTNLEQKRNQRVELKQMLDTMQEKLLVGTQASEAEREEADRLASELHRAKIEEEERRRQEQRLKEDILQKEEDRDLVEEQYSSLKEEEQSAKSRSQSPKFLCDLKNPGNWTFSDDY